MLECISTWRSGVQPSHQLRAVFVAVLFKVFNERRAPRADIGVVARDAARLLVDVARRVFEMAGAEAGRLLEAGVERRLQPGVV